MVTYISQYTDSQTYIAGYLRDENNQIKVYFTLDSAEQEYLLYDFTIQLDSFCSIEDIKITVTKIDNLLINGSKRL